MNVMGSYLHFLFLTTYVFLLSTQGQGQGHEQGQFIIDRHNYGFTLTKTGSLGLTTATAPCTLRYTHEWLHHVRNFVRTEQNKEQFSVGDTNRKLFTGLQTIFYFCQIYQKFMWIVHSTILQMLFLCKNHRWYFLYSVVVCLSLTPYFITVLLRIVLKIKTFQTVYKYHTALI